jgi:hypothetical protein
VISQVLNRRRRRCSRQEALERSRAGPRLSAAEARLDGVGGGGDDGGDGLAAGDAVAEGHERSSAD